MDSSLDSMRVTDTATPSPPKLTILDESTNELSQSLMDDLPLVMYGSGDIYPYQRQTRNAGRERNLLINDTNTNEKDEEVIEYRTNVKTTSLLAHLTTSFIHDLVHAAVDSHDIYTDGRSGNGGGIVPSFDVHKKKNSESAMDGTCDDSRHERKRKFLESLTPSIHSSKSKKNILSPSNLSHHSNRNNGTHLSEWEDDLPIPTITSQSKDQTKNKKRQDYNHETKKKSSNHVDIFTWQGAAGLNFHSNILRSKYLSSTTTINEKSFLLPICHDDEMYNRCKEIISFHNDALDVIYDPSLRGFVQDGLEENEFMNTMGSSNSTASSVNGDDGKKGIGNDTDKKDRDSKRQRSNSLSGDYSGLSMVYGWPGIDKTLQEILPKH